MAFPTFIFAAVLFGAYALYKYWDTCRRHRVPAGLKPLPGPKGIVLHPLLSQQGLCDEHTEP